MLHKEAVGNRLMVILKKLMDIHELNNFSLVGGTVLALQFGHRKSEDWESFCPPFKEINLLKIESEIEKVFPGSKSFSGSRTNMSFYINEIKVDFVYYPYKNIRDEIIEENIRMFSINELLDHSDYGHYLRSLTYIEDAEKSPEPKILNHLSRKQVKANVQKAGLDFFSQKTNENK
ncbi:MAG: hypothetical protein EPN39_18000 [Chitinophagaceae bacterium]|nr:MAG: hypothetical protein EPN39_18000 [Chitinophagaceae bacterium]